MSPKSPTSWRMAALVGFTLALMSARAAAADVAAPMLVYVYPGLILLLVPIIIFEALVGCRVLGARFGSALKVSALANAASTLLGVPIVWLALAVVTWTLALVVYLFHPPSNDIVDTISRVAGSAFVIDSGTKPWQFYAGALILCIPFYFVSVRVEARVAARLLPSMASETVGRWSRLANLLSYSLIAVILLAVTVQAAIPPPLPYAGLDSTFTQSVSHGRVVSGSTSFAGDLFTTQVTGRYSGQLVFDRTVNTIGAPPGDPAVAGVIRQATAAIQAAAGRPVSVVGPRPVQSRTETQETTFLQVWWPPVETSHLLKRINGRHDAPKTICVGDLGQWERSPSSQPVAPCPPGSLPFVQRPATLNFDHHVHVQPRLSPVLHVRGRVTTSVYELVAHLPDH